MDDVAQQRSRAVPHFHADNRRAADMGELVITSFIAIAGSMVLIATVDVPFQLWEHHRKLKMTKEEVRQENKETEGDPHVKGRIRAQQRAMARKRMMAEIPKADVIITNPTHYSVALNMRKGKMRAPRLVAKGTHLMALKIREVGQEHQVPVLEAPPLARAYTTMRNWETRFRSRSITP